RFFCDVLHRSALSYVRGCAVDGLRDAQRLDYRLRGGEPRAGMHAHGNGAAFDQLGFEDRAAAALSGLGLLGDEAERHGADAAAEHKGMDFLRQRDLTHEDIALEVKAVVALARFRPRSDRAL